MDLFDAFDRAERVIRIPDGQSVPLPGPWARLVDHPDFQRLRRVRQLSAIHLVYPGAVHTRFEHSLGVLAATLDYLRGLLRRPAFRDRVGPDDVHALLAAALLHDIGHYPFAHSLEALHSRAFAVPRHEELAAELIYGRLTADAAEGGPSLGDLLEDGLDIPRERVAALVRLGTSSGLPPVDQLLASVIHSAIDADKLDYLERDSIHLGVPYGRMPDRHRLFSSLTVNAAGTRVALTEKGRVAGEIFMFCRYLMFSEAYWHHTARAASAMIEAALADLIARERPVQADLVGMLLTQSDDDLLVSLSRSQPGNSLSSRLLAGLTPNARGLYKRILTLNRQREGTDRKRAYDVLYQLDRAGQDALRERLRQRLAALAGVAVEPGDLLVDVPPRDKDRMDSVPVVSQEDGRLEEAALEDLSTVVRGIGSDFVKVVKKIRVFVRPELRARLADQRARVEALLLDEILA